MISPPLLKAGDRVALVGTAKIVLREELQPGLDLLREWGLDPVPSKHLFEPDYQFASTDENRMRDLQEAIDDPDIRCILFARGGYGTLRILDQVDLSPLQKDPKWLVGFSDLTPLLNRCYNEGIISLHAPMGVNLRGLFADSDSIAHLRKLLMQGGEFLYRYPAAFPELQKKGKASGKLRGGCISLLSHMMGTASEFDTEGCLFFIEDIDEYLYHLDRLCVHLLRGGKLSKPAAVMVGGLVEMKDNDDPFGKSPQQIVADAMRDFHYPLCFEFPVGHWPRNYPIPIGVFGELEVEANEVTLRFRI